ncbi:TadE/TadG family type IV pilus assembly protein [Agromyces lapidis]|uniref:Pilus assembly protein TadG-related protein n=1 Tax=Agromyces lapidis TaxID=279574 RepID=A0ABV5ST44_9MICO|nr:pilus assembly protein TadG-related protein [Agromyces lapidis]
MRRLNERLRRERGASAVLTAILLIPILGMAAIGVDTGMLYYERAQLQNAADSAALAVATKCSVSRCPGDTTIASSFANGNAFDGAVTIDDQVIDRSARTVRIDVSTLNGDGTSAPFHPFAAAIGVTDNSPVTATATAHWAGGNITIPLALSSCEFERMVGAEGAEDHDAHWVRFDENKLCKDDPLEPPLPGGFGWLDPLLDDDGNPVGCLAETSADGTTSGSDTGNNGISNEFGELCHAVFTEPPPEGHTLYVPIFDSGEDQGSKAVVHIAHYAKVSLLGWAFGGGREVLPNFWERSRLDVDNIDCRRSCRGLLLEFQEYVPVGSVPGTDISTAVSLLN